MMALLRNSFLPKFDYMRNAVDYSKFFGVLLVALLFMQLQLLSEYDSLFGFSYWIIPDSITHYELTRGLVHGELTLGELRSSAGVLLYFAIFFKLGVLGFVFANALLLAISVRYFGFSVLYVTLLLYPHYLQLLILPSKDLMVLTVYFLVVFYLLKANFLIAIVLSIFAFYIRDAAMFVLLPLVVVAVLIKTSILRPFWIVVISFLLGIVAFHLLEEWGQEFFVVARNSAALNEISSDSVRNLPVGIDYIARVFFNLTNMAFRLPFEDNFGGISVASVFMYISGISSLVCCGFAAISILKSSDKSIQLVSVFYFISLFLISLNPFIQGRYQFPMAIVSSLILFRNIDLKLLLLAFCVAVLVSFIFRYSYIYMGIEMPGLEVNPVDFWSLIES